VVENIDAGYHYLAEHGLAAEDARGLLPHATATRIHVQNNLREIMKMAGERLCTQAQFPWKMLLTEMVQAIKMYTPDFSWIPQKGGQPQDQDYVRWTWENTYRWQFRTIAESKIFRPVCYHTNECMFKASADRSCTIRERVEIRSRNGSHDSDQWHKPFMYPGHKEDGTLGYLTSEGINPAEWALDPAAARSI